MAIRVYRDVGLWVDGQSLACVSNQAAIEYTSPALDATTFCDETRGYLPGGFEVRCEASGFYDPEVETPLFAAMGGGHQVVTMAPAGRAVGDVAYAFQAEISSLTHSGSWGELARYELSAEAAKGARLIRGVIAHVGSAVNADGYGDALDLGVLDSGQQLYCIVHVTASAGTSPQLVITIESDADGTFSTPITRLTVPTISASGATWASPVQGPIATDDNWRVAVDVSGSGAEFDFLVILAIL